jgi:hypothetical protein
MTASRLGAHPDTIVIAPGGKIIYHHANQIDAADLPARIVDQPGAYYSLGKN